MPSSAGTSTVGLQFLVQMNNVPPRFLNVFYQAGGFGSRLERVGTLLVVFKPNADQHAVCSAHKLYSNGVALGSLPEWPGVTLAAWANWFQAGIIWTAQSA